MGRLQIFFEEAGRVFRGQASHQEVVQVPGLIPRVGLNRQIGLRQFAGQIKEIGFENGGLEQVFTLADGGHHVAPAGEAVAHLVEQAFHTEDFSV